MTWSLESPEAPKIVLSYASQDEELKEELGKHLSLLQRQGAIGGWQACKIGDGHDSSDTSDDPFGEANVVLLLISVDYVSSNYCYGPQVQQAVQRHEGHDACLIPVLGRPVPWRATPFGALAPLPADGQPVTKWSNQDDAFGEITQGIMATVKQTLKVEQRAGGASQASSGAATRGAAQAAIIPPPQTELTSEPVGGDAASSVTHDFDREPAQNASPRVFVSSTFEDLKRHRSQVIQSLSKSGLTLDPMENWTASAHEPKQFSQRRVEDCELCVLLVGFRRGFVPDGEERSITQMEYDAAIAQGIDVLVFMLDDDSLWHARFDERREDPEIETWRQMLRKRHGVEFFDHDPASLRVEAAVMRWFAERQGPPSSSCAKNCIETLAELMQKDRKVFSEAVRFQADFEMISRQSKLLGDHKDLHDLLHELQIHSYNVIVDAASYFPDDKSREHLGRYETELRNSLDRMDRVTSRSTFSRGQVAWMSDLRRADEALCEAVDGLNEAKLQEAIREMRDVLAIQPSKIDTWLNALASQFRLSDLVGAMKSICEHVSSLGIEAEKREHFESGARELEALDARLQQLIDAHFRWQAAEDNLRRIEGFLRRDLQELIHSWSDLQSDIEGLYDTGSPAQAEEFREAAAKLDEAIRLNDPFKTRQYFRRYRAHSTELFFETDKRLRDLCDKLRAVAAPLDSILDILR